MNGDISVLLKKLITEKFDGKEPNWREASWGDAKVLCVGDNNNWYYKHEKTIYVQAKSGDQTPHCYDCGSVINFKTQHRSVWDSPIPCSGSGEVRTVDLPYCPKCEKAPSQSGVIIE